MFANHAGESRKLAASSEKRPDRRIQRTRALLHEALGSLIREKAYDRITIAEVLERAKISRSTFYQHFRDKDDLLANGMRALLLAALLAEDRADADPAERAAAFSLPLLTHINQHRRSAKVKLGERGRAILHEHLRHTLSVWIVQTMDVETQSRRQRRAPVDPTLLARHIASTFVLVLHWWLDQGGRASPADTDKLFRALVMPVLRSAPS
ncbi:MAG: TetR/AcrR family transcriptional regulator [Steroidobacteraceae bacterium]